MIDVPGAKPVTGAQVGGTAVTFRLPGPGHRFAGVRLGQDVRIPGDRLDFHRAGADWERFDDHERWFRYYPRGVGHEVPDMHNYTAWRDAFDPYLTQLLAQACG